jgi:hypothetical protein
LLLLWLKLVSIFTYFILFFALYHTTFSFTPIGFGIWISKWSIIVVRPFCDNEPRFLCSLLGGVESMQNCKANIGAGYKYLLWAFSSLQSVKFFYGSILQVNIVAGTRTVTSNWSPGSLVDFKGLNLVIFL